MRRDERVLVVEDNPMICEAIEQAGVRLQFECDCATDGWDAIEKLETGDYTTIVIDADVPRHSGYGVLTYLREEIGDDMPNVILMTSSADRDEVRRKVGANMTVVDKNDAVAEITRAFSRS